MGIYNSANALLKGIDGRFKNALATMPQTELEKMATIIPSQSDKEIFWIPSSLPGIHEWNDKIVFKSMQDFAYEIRNKDYASGIAVDRNVLNDSNKEMPGAVQMQIDSAIDRYKGFNSKLMSDALDANGNAFDGTAFFADSRPNIDTGGNTIDNLYSGTGVTQALLTADFEGALNQLLSFRDKNDELYNAEANPAVIIPLHLLPAFRKILLSQYFAGGVDNLNLNAATIIVNNRQTASNNDWYIANLTPALKAFLITDRDQPKWNVNDKWDEKFIGYGYTFRKGIGYGNPMSIIKINN